MALSWIAERPTVIAPIIGGRTVAQLQQNIAAADLELGVEATTRLNTVSAPTPNDYPYGPFGIEQRHLYVDSSKQAIVELS